jgi:hypothetical protein
LVDPLSLLETWDAQDNTREGTQLEARDSANGYLMLQGRDRLDMVTNDRSRVEKKEKAGGSIERWKRKRG